MTQRKHDAQHLRWGCVPTFILAGQSNTLGHNIEARDLPRRGCGARTRAAFASVVTMGTTGPRRPYPTGRLAGFAVS